MDKEANLAEILAHAEALRAKHKYTEAISYLCTYVGQISTDADARLSDAISNVRADQVKVREKAIQEARASRADTSIELEEVERLHRLATSRDFWSDNEIEQSDEYQELAAYRDELSNSKSQVRADIVISRVAAGFALGDSRQANWEWLRAQRTKLESIPFREGLRDLKQRVEDAIKQVGKQAQLYDSRSQHLQLLPLIEYYDSLWRRGIEEAVEPQVQDDQVIETGQGRRVKVAEKRETLLRELAEDSLRKARGYFSQVAQVIGQTGQAQEQDETTFSVNLVSAWNNSPVIARRLTPQLDRVNIRKNIHLGLYQLDPKQYTPKYEQQTDAPPASQSDPRPNVFANFGLLDDAVAVERALNSALDLLDRVQERLNSPGRFALKDFYEAYHHHPHESALSKLEEKERETLKPYEEEKAKLGRQSVEALLDDQLDEQLAQVQAFRQRLQAEPFFGLEYIPAASRERLDGLVRFADEREAQLKAQQEMRNLLAEYKEQFNRYIKPFNAEACTRLYKQLEAFPEAERDFLMAGLKEQLTAYRQLADEATTFAQLELAFESALAAQGERAPHDLLQSTQRRQYLANWHEVRESAVRYSDPKNAAQSRHWSEGRFYFLFSSAMAKCLEIGELSRSDEKRRALCQEAHEQLLEIERERVIERYAEDYAALRDSIKKIAEDVEQTLAATQAAREIWTRRIIPLIDSEDYLRRDYAKAEQIIENEVSEKERADLRARLYSEWCKALEEQIEKFLPKR
jgi:hypothetical protein